MKQKRITLILTIILLVTFVTLFLVQYLLFDATKPTFKEMIENVILYSEQEQWDEANQTLSKVEKKWKTASPLVAVKYSDQDYSLLNIAFARLRGAINTRDVHGAQREGKVCIYIFENITSISPKP